MAHELVAGSPIPFQGEIVEWDDWRGDIMDLFGSVLTTWIGEILRSGEAKVGLGRGTAADGSIHVGVCVGWYRVARIGKNQTWPGLLQQFANLHFSLAVIALADVHIDDVAVFIDQKVC